MKRIPVVKLTEQVAFQKHFDRSSIDALMEQIDDTTVYIIDDAGIKKNHPQVNIYQQLATRYELWVDAGPRHTGDMIDIVFTGVKRVIIRPWIWKEVGFGKVRSMTDHQLLQLSEASVVDRQSIERSVSVMDEFDGIIVYIIGDWKKRRFKNEEMLKALAQRDEAYVYEPAGLHESTWDNYGFTGMLYDGFKNEVME